MTAPTIDPMISTAEAAARTGHRSENISRWARQGKIRAELRPGPTGAPAWYVHPDDIPTAAFDPIPDGWATVDDAAQATGWSIQTISRWALADQIEKTLVRRGTRKLTIVRLASIVPKHTPDILAEEWAFFRSFGYPPERCAARLAQVYGLTPVTLLKRHEEGELP